MKLETERLLIVVPCLNEEAHLPALLRWLIEENPNSTIVVADGGSADASRAIVEAAARKHSNLSLIDNPFRLQSAGINRAVERFGDGHEWLLRIDAHCEYPDDYAAVLLSAASAANATSVVVPMVSRGTHCFQIAAATAQNSVLGTGGSPHRHVGRGRFVDHGHHALMRIDLFREVGGYREDMSHNEDAELDLRLLAAGGSLWLEPGAAIVYYPRGTIAGLWRQYSGYGRGRFRTLVLHMRRPKMRQLLPVGVAVAAFGTAFGLLWWPLALPGAVWAAGSVSYGILLGVRRGSGCGALSGVAAMVMHLAWSIGFVGAAASEVMRSLWRGAASKKRLPHA